MGAVKIEYAILAARLLVDTLTAIYVGIGLAAFVFALVGRAIWRKFNARSDANEGPPLWLLEFQLRSAILDATPRERLLKKALRSTRGGRAAAIRKVLRDLENETDAATGWDQSDGTSRTTARANRSRFITSRL